MDDLRWKPRIELTAREEMLLRTVKRTKMLFSFFRRHRHELFNKDFQEELAATYRGTGAGRAPHPPAFMAMVVLLQAYTGVSDAEAVQRSVTDLLWQMTLDGLGAEKALFSQGSLHDFRQRLISHDLDRRLLERTAELAEETGCFDRKKLPKTLRLAADSKPLLGAGRVEDTFNLLGHAARDVVQCVAELLDESPEAIACTAGIPLVAASSTKLALDTDWTESQKKTQALQKLFGQLKSLLNYVEKRLPGQSSHRPLLKPLELLQQLIDQDLEPDPDDPTGKRKRIHQGVAKDRRVSVCDSDMRHGRKTKSKPFNGFKEHVAVDLDRRLVLACAVVAANRREYDALPDLQEDLERYNRPLAEMHVDRGYVTPSLVEESTEKKFELLSKPRQMPPNNGLFTKRDFKFDLRDRTVTCPAGQTQSFQPGVLLEFDEETCRSCELRKACTRAKRGRGMQISEDEVAQQRFLRLVQTKRGRERLRERIPVEHRLAHLKQKQGDRARYTGTRANLFDLRREAAVLNLEIIHHESAKAA